MPFIPHTEEDIEVMLSEIDIDNIDELFDEIPSELKQSNFNAIPEGLSELEVTRLMQERAKQDEAGLCFIGAGSYEHHVPAIIPDLLSRGEFLTAYTPYQAEASQGNLQIIYEFQTMVANLMGMEVCNASLYDGASGLAEAVLMAVRANRKSKSKTVLIPANVNPVYTKVVNNIVNAQDINIESVPYCADTGLIKLDSLEKFTGKDITALVIAQPNFFGGLDEVHQLTDWAKEQNCLVIALVNPIAMAILKEPGNWGKTGADIVCGEGQPLGVPLASGGPYFGFLCCKQQFVRQMPGRIVGRTTDQDGKVGYTLTLQAREQHIRRSKATSNICTNQGLMVTAAAMYMSLLGPEGLKRVASMSHSNATQLKQQLITIDGVELMFEGPVFHEFLLRLNKPVYEVLTQLAEHGVQGGFAVEEFYPDLSNCLLVCATETKTEKDLKHYGDSIKNIFAVAKASGLAQKKTGRFSRKPR